MAIRAETQVDLARVDDGSPGVSPTATVTKVGDTATITITDINQTTTASISDGTNGYTPYIQGGYWYINGTSTGVKAEGEDGTTSVWYYGTSITGTSTTPTVFSGSGIANAVVGDMYLNTDNSNVYQCALGGNASTAKWVYAGTIAESVFKVKTESGSIITITDASNYPALDLVADINPIQPNDYSSVWVGGAGKNKLPFNLDEIKSRNTSGTWSGNAYTVSGVTFTVNSNGTVSTSGTSSANIFFKLTQATLTSGTYIFSGCPSGGGNSGYSIRVVENSNVRDYGNGYTLTVSATTSYITQIVCGGNGNVNMNGKVFYPMIRLSSVSDATYAPYENICPISGWSLVNTYVRGFNLFDGEFELGTLDTSTGEVGTHSSRNVSPNYQPIVPSVQYYCKSSVATYAFFYDKDKNYIGYHGSQIQNSAFTPQSLTNSYNGESFSTARYVRFRCESATADSTFCLNIYNSDKNGTYEAYQGNTYTSSLGRTVYGGTLNLVSGVLTVTHGNIASYNGETLPSTWISDRDVYASGATPTTGAQVVYELATPQTYQLTPQQVELLTGTNYVWADTGNSTIVYSVMSDDAAQTLNAIKNIAESATQYAWHTETDTGAGAGTHITAIPQEDFEANPSGLNVLIDNVGVKIRNGLDVLASYGTNVTLGADGESQTVIDGDSLTIYSNSGAETFEATVDSGLTEASYIRLFKGEIITDTETYTLSPTPYTGYPIRVQLQTGGVYPTTIATFTAGTSGTITTGSYTSVYDSATETVQVTNASGSDITLFGIYYASAVPRPANKLIGSVLSNYSSVSGTEDFPIYQALLYTGLLSSCTTSINGVSYLDFKKMFLQFLGMLRPSRSASGLTPYSGRCTVTSGGVYSVGAWRFIQLRLKINTSLSANNTWGILDGFDHDEDLATDIALSAVAIKNGGAISAYISDTGRLVLATDNAALAADDVVLITGWYTTI